MGRFKVSLPERTVRLCLDGALQAEWEVAEKALSDARAATTRDARMTGNAEVEKAAKAVRDIEERMERSVLTFRLRALPRSEWADLLVKHPPKTELDKQFGAARSDFFEDAIPASIVEVTQNGETVDFDVDEDWPDLAESMTDWQFNQFAAAVFGLNRSEVDIPFSAAASRTIRRSERNSN